RGLILFPCLFLGGTPVLRKTPAPARSLRPEGSAANEWSPAIRFSVIAVARCSAYRGRDALVALVSARCFTLQGRDRRAPDQRSSESQDFEQLPGVEIRFTQASYLAPTA